MLINIQACNTHNPLHSVVPNNLYNCDNARQLTISIGDMNRLAVIQYEGRDIALEKIPAARGLAFSNNIFTLFFDDKRAVLEREGVPILTGCHPD